jgi:proteasome accessory factor A
MEPRPVESTLSAGRFLAGIETEYGFTVEGRSANEQIDDAIAFVRGYPGDCFAGWDYSYESPRADLRGFRLDRLAFDPEDAKRDAGKDYGAPHDVRSDRILPNGARFYNDHGHPEYATPECRSLAELALHDKAGELVLLRAAKALAESTGRAVRVFKNNTDFHGSSYGTHESYLVPRRLGFDKLFQAVTPILVCRPLLTGAGKVGSESGEKVAFQLSSRADFAVEAANAETLFRRPVFNTRDEPHANPAEWIRLHVISGDANMIPSCTTRKVGLVKLALMLCEIDQAPTWDLLNPPRAFQVVSRDDSMSARLELKGRSWTTADAVIESYFACAERFLDLDTEMLGLIDECRSLIDDLRGERTLARQHIDWAAKRHMLETFISESGSDWNDPTLQAYDLEYHQIDPEEGLYFALESMGDVEPYPALDERLDRLSEVPERTRAWARGLAVRRFKEQLARACWHSLTFRLGDAEEEVVLPPDLIYPAQLATIHDVGTFIDCLRNARNA